jgi:hypothetical protein
MVRLRSRDAGRNLLRRNAITTAVPRIVTAIEWRDEIFSRLFLASLASFRGRQQAGREPRAHRVDRELLEERPNDPTLWFYLSRVPGPRRASARVGGRAREGARAGEGFLPTRDGLRERLGDKAFQATRAKLERSCRASTIAPHLQLDDRDRMLIPEGIAYDAHCADVFMGSVAQTQASSASTATNTVTEFAGRARASIRCSGSPSTRRAASSTR